MSLQDRLNRLDEARSSAGAQAYIATQRANQLYLIDSAEPVSDLPPVSAILFSDEEPLIFAGAPFFFACRDHLPNYKLAPTLVGTPSVWTQLAAELRRRGLHRVVIDPIPAAAEAQLRAELHDIALLVDPAWGPRLRRTKEPAEIAIMREAARISDIGMVAAFAAAKPGVSGRAVAAAAAAAMLEAGAEDASLQVAVGPATAYMGTGDWIYTPRGVLADGDMLLVDMAIRVHGYLGDQTRTAIVGDGTPEQRQLIDVVQTAYKTTVSAMRPGVSSRELYAITVNLLKDYGWAEYFPHHISHGLGLGGDLPRVAADSDDVLQVGDALSCEPGVYVPGLGGARFENMLIVSADGVEALTQSPVDPVTGA